MTDVNNEFTLHSIIKMLFICTVVLLFMTFIFTGNIQGALITLVSGVMLYTIGTSFSSTQKELN